MSRKILVIVPGYNEARKKEKKEKSSARSRGGTSCPPPPDDGTSSAYGGALSSDFYQVTNMVIAVEKGSTTFPPMKDTFEIQIVEIDLGLQKFNSPWLSFPGELFLRSIPYLANSFDGENSGSINEVNPKNPNRSIPSESSTLTLLDGNLVPRKWKKMARKNNPDDLTMHATMLGKLVGEKMDEDQPKLPSKKIQVSKEDGRTFFEFAEVDNRPRQHTMNCLVWNCHGLGNL